MSILKFKDYRFTKCIALILVWAMVSLDCAWAQDALAPGTKVGKAKHSEVQTKDGQMEVGNKEISERGRDGGRKEVIETGFKAGILITVPSALSGLTDLITQHPILSILTAVGGVVSFFASWRLLFPVSWFNWKLKSKNWEVRSTAAGALGWERNARAVKPLIEALRDDNNYVRRIAAWALGQIGDAQAVEPLIEALRDDNNYVRRAAAKSLGQIGDARAVEPLKRVLGDGDEVVRRVAAEALEKIIGQLTVESLRRAREQREEADRQVADAQTSLQEKSATLTTTKGEVEALEARLAERNKASQEAEAAFTNARKTCEDIVKAINELMEDYNSMVQSAHLVTAEAIKKALVLREEQLKGAQRIFAEKQKKRSDAEAAVKAINQELQKKRAQLAGLSQDIESLNAQIAQWNQTLLDLEAGGQLAQQALGAML